MSPWVMTSLRVRGSAAGAPHTIFKIGTVTVATITMVRSSSAADWSFQLALADGTVVGDWHDSFGDAMREMHHLLQSPSPEGYK